MAKPKGLGRGLDALLSPVEPDGDRLETIEVGAIVPSQYQPRRQMKPEALEDLARSIQAQGVIQPVVVRKLNNGQFELIAGERRWRATQLAQMTHIPAIVREVPDESVLAMALIENIQRQELDPIEEALGFRRLIDEFELTHEKVAEAVGRSRSAVSNLLRLLQLPEALQEMLHDGRLEMGHARALLGLSIDQQLSLACQTIEKDWSVREVEQRVKQIENIEKQPKKRLLDNPDVRRLCESLSEAVGAKVTIKSKKNGQGSVTISYSSLEELDGLIEKLHGKSRL